MDDIQAIPAPAPSAPAPASSAPVVPLAQSLPDVPPSPVAAGQLPIESIPSPPPVQHEPPIPPTSAEAVHPLLPAAQPDLPTLPLLPPSTDPPVALQIDKPAPKSMIDPAPIQRTKKKKKKKKDRPAAVPQVLYLTKKQALLLAAELQSGGGRSARLKKAKPLGRSELRQPSFAWGRRTDLLLKQAGSKA